MELTQVFSFTIVASLLVMSPGPNGILIAKTVPYSGKSAGFANVAGFVAAFYIHGSLSILGISRLLVKSEQVFFFVKTLGVLYLCWLGFKALWDAWFNSNTLKTTPPDKTKHSLNKSFVEGFLTNLLNPKVSMFYLAAFPQFLTVESDISSAFLLVFIHSVINLFWFSTMVLLFSKLVGATNNTRFRRGLNTITGLIFISLGAKLATLRI